MVSPHNVLSPKTQIKRIVSVIHDGTINGDEFSLAELELHNGDIVIGIRHDYSYWSKNPDKGYPLIMGQYPCWFILPELNKLSVVIQKYVSSKGSKTI